MLVATFLYRLGKLAARRTKTVIASWLVLLVLAVSSFLAFGGQLSDQFSVPDMPTTEVTDRLADELPDASGGSAVVVLRTQNSEAFTDEQREQIAELGSEVEGLDPVREVTDPFDVQEQIAEGSQELTDAQEELDSGREELSEGREELESSQTQLEEGQEQLDAGQAQLDEGQAELDSAREDAEAAGMLPMVEGELDAQQAQIDAQQAEIDSQQEELDAGREELEAGREELESGEQELADGEVDLQRGEAMFELSEGTQLVSDDGDVAIMIVSFDEPLENVAIEEVSEVANTLTDFGIDGVDVLPSGDLSMELPHLFSVAEAIGLAIAAIVLLVMLGTFIGAGLPIFNALVGVGIGVTGALALSGTIEMMSITPILGLMLGLAVGIDYTLFILHRHRTQLRSGMSVADSIPLANGTSGNAVVFAGATVVIALAALNLTGLPFLGLMGTVGAVCVAIAVLIAITLTPALLSLLGERVLRKRERAEASQAREANGNGDTAEQDAKKITTPMKTIKAVGMALVAVIVLGALAVPSASMRLGLPGGDQQAEDSTAYQAYKEIDESFGEGMNGQLVVVADLPSGLDEGEAMDEQIAVGNALIDHDAIASAAPIGLNDDRTVAVFQLIPEEGPSSVAVENLIHELRDGEILNGTDVSGVELSVAGITAANIDISEIIADALPLYLAVVVGLSLVLMVMVFRSLLLPLIATGGFVLSYLAALGGVVAVYQWGVLSGVFGVTEPGPVLSFLPIIMVGILFGLAMDYQLFTASGMREAYAHGAPPRVAVRRGLHAGRAVVTAAALIMASVFGGFIFTPDPMISSIGLGLALGVLLDAFVVRMLLVPALLHLAGPAAWWLPKWLDRILPNVDVEGAALAKVHGTADGEDHLADDESGDDEPASEREPADDDESASEREPASEDEPADGESHDGEDDAVEHSPRDAQAGRSADA